MLNEDLYKQYNIDKNCLKRDYILNPLKKISRKWELPFKEDLEYLFYDLKLQKKDVANILGIDFVKLGRVMRAMNIHLVQLHIKKVCTENFYEKFKIDATKLKRDYLINPLHLKRGDTSNEKPYKEDLEYLLSKGIYLNDIGIYFGVDQTCLIKWMKYWNLRTNIRPITNRKENKSTELLLKYDIDVTKLSRDYTKEPLKITANRTAVGYVIETPKQRDLEYLFIELNMSRKEVAQYFNVSEPQIKIWNRKYNIKKDWDKVQQNVVKTQIELGRPFDSCDEKKIYEILLTKYDKSDIKFHYWTKEYPYSCDFYIESLKLYIEYQGYGGGHNNRPFLNTIEDLKELEHHMKLAENGNSMSQRIVRTWYMKDPEKRKIAKDNKLNWMEFFNMKQFMEWFDKQ